MITSWYVENRAGRYPIAELEGVLRHLAVDHSRWMELRARYRDADVLLFGTRDKAEFEQVRRALIRALELNRPPLP